MNIYREIESLRSKVIQNKVKKKSLIANDLLTYILFGLVRLPKKNEIIYDFAFYPCRSENIFFIFFIENAVRAAKRNAT